METTDRLVLTFLLNSVWQATLVAGVAALGARLARSAPARYRHGLWVMALGLSVLLPLASLRNVEVQEKGVTVQSSSSHVTQSATLPPSGGPTRRNTVRAAGPRGATGLFSWQAGLFSWQESWRRPRPVSLAPAAAYAVVGCYLMFLLLGSIRFWNAWRRTRAIRRTAYRREMPEGMASVVARCRAALGLEDLSGRARPAPGKPLVSILCSGEACGPLTLGACRPAIVLPQSLFEAASSEDLSAALCHEMAHIRRHDFLLNLICELAYLPISFHPAARLVKRRIDQTRELACDELAAGQVVTPSAYARSLVSLARTMSGFSSLASASGLAGSGYTLGVFDADILEERVMRLLEKRPRASIRQARLALLVATLLLAAGSWAASAFSLSVGQDARAAALAASKKLRAHPDFSGAWVLDKTKSHFDGMFPRGITLNIEQQEAQLKIKTRLEDWFKNSAFPKGELPLRVPELLLTTDNVEREQQSDGMKFKSRTHWDGGALITSLNFLGRESILVRYLSPDGQLQYLDVKNLYPNGDPEQLPSGNAELVFVRSSSAIGPEITDSRGPATEEGIGALPATGEQERTIEEDFLGSWEGTFGGRRFVTVELEWQDGRLTGTVSPFNISTDKDGNLTAAEPASHGGWRIAEAQHNGKMLLIKGQDKESGDVDWFELAVVRPNAAQFVPKGMPTPIRPWTMRRLSGDPQNDVVTGGPSAGVIGDVSGVVSGVVGGVRSGVPGGAKGGVIGGVPGDVQRRDEQAQVSISGTVSDPSEARVPNAIVSVVNVDTGLKHTTVADDAGEYSFASLPPGHYRLQANQPGFAVYHGKEYALAAGLAAPVRDIVQDIVLEPGSVLQAVEVTAKAPSASPASAGVRGGVAKGAPRRIRVGGLIQTTQLVSSKKPEYPEGPRAKGIQGVVLLEAVISKEGEPLSLKVVSSPDPELSKAAMDAVREWRYDSTLLNGEPIEVVTTIAVRFRLAP